MHEFRRLVRGPIGKILLGVISLAFIVSGFYGYFAGGGENNVVAEVADSPIYRQQLNQQVQRYRARVRQQQPELDPSMIESFINPSRVLDGMVNNELILAYARDADMVVSEDQAVSILREAPAFRDEQGNFSRERFEQMVSGSGMSPKSYVAGLRKDLLLNQVRMAFQNTDFALPRELAEQRRLGEQTRSFRYLMLPVGEVAAGLDVSDDEIREFYESHRDDFMRPERFKLAYIELDPTTYEKDVTISDEAVQREYEARKKMRDAVGQNRGARREAAHILIQTGDVRSEEEALGKARELYQRIQQGAAFEELAREESEDPASAQEGGSLGVIQEGALPEPMDEALQSLEPGQVSEPVVTEAGVHLVKLQSVKKRELPSLEELREQIMADLKQAKVDELMAADVNELETLAYDHPGLQTPAEKLGVEVKTTDWFSLQGAQGIAAHQSVREALQSAAVSENGQNSELLELGDGRYVVVRLADRQAPEPLALSDVENSIRTRIKRSRARQQLEEWSEEARARVDAGQVALSDLAEKWGVETQSAEAVQRGASQPNARLVSEAFSMPRPGDGISGPQLLRLPDGGLAALTLTDVTDGNPGGLGPQQQAMALAQLGEREGEYSFRQLMSWLRSQLEVEIDESVLGKMEGDGSSSEG